MIAQRTAIVTRAATILLSAFLLQACSGNPPRLDDSRPQAQPVPAISVGERAAQVAVLQVGVPYRYGGETPNGFDCSGLVHYAYGEVGVSVPRTTGQLWSATASVDRRNLRKGDLLFFSIEGKMQHVGLYIGNGRFVHAPSTGRVVSVESLTAPYYRSAFLRGGRPR